jgi:hypothetical protein
MTTLGVCPLCCVGHLYVSPVVPGELLCTHCRQVATGLDLAPAPAFDVAVAVYSTNPQPWVEGWVNP